MAKKGATPKPSPKLKSEAGKEMHSRKKIDRSLGAGVERWGQGRKPTKKKKP